jgi:hypothetical protein
MRRCFRLAALVNVARATVDEHDGHAEGLAAP